jgi:hypothetical protein
VNSTGCRVGTQRSTTRLGFPPLCRTLSRDPQGRPSTSILLAASIDDSTLTCLARTFCLLAAVLLRAAVTRALTPKLSQLNPNFNPKMNCLTPKLSQLNPEMSSRFRSRPMCWTPPSSPADTTQAVREMQVASKTFFSASASS